MEHNTHQIADEFIKDHGKGRSTHKVLCIICAISMITFAVIALINELPKSPLALFPIVLIFSFALASLYVWYYIGKSVLMMRDRMAIAAKENDLGTGKIKRT